MLYLTLKESIFDSDTGKYPWNKMTLAESKKCYFLMESTEAEIGTLPIIPTALRPSPYSEHPISVPRGANSFRTIAVRRFTPINIDERYWILCTSVSGGANMVSKISEAIEDGILSVKYSKATDPTADLTGHEFFNLMFNSTETA